jgi:hypothetical protein
MRCGTCWEDGKAAPCHPQRALEMESDTVEGWAAVVVANIHPSRVHRSRRWDRTVDTFAALDIADVACSEGIHSPSVADCHPYAVAAYLVAEVALQGCFCRRYMVIPAASG